MKKDVTHDLSGGFNRNQRRKDLTIGAKAFDKIWFVIAAECGVIDAGNRRVVSLTFKSDEHARC